MLSDSQKQLLRAKILEFESEAEGLDELVEYIAVLTDEGTRDSLKTDLDGLTASDPTQLINWIFDSLLSKSSTSSNSLSTSSSTSSLTSSSTSPLTSSPISSSIAPTKSPPAPPSASD